MQAVRTYLAPRLRLLACASIAGCLWSAAGTRVDERSTESIAAALSRASGCEVDRVVWEPRRSSASELVFGRPVLFTARHAAERRDVFRAFVRLAPSGAPLGVRGVRNLTETRLADELGLSASGNLALYATEQAGRIGSFTALALDGASSDRKLGPFEWVRTTISRYLIEGDTQGLGRTDLLLAESSSSADVTERGPHFAFRLEKVEFSLSRQTLREPNPRLDAATLAHVSVVHREFEPTSSLQWAADSLRTVMGPGPVAWLEGRVFSTLDRLHRWTRSSGDFHVAPRPAATHSNGAAPTSVSVDPATRAWPPVALEPRLTPARPGEGQWLAWSADFLPEEGRREPYFYRTFLHPDATRPYAELVFVAIDTRRLELGMRAGYEDPHPETGPPGSGHIPDDSSVFSRITATFNGAFKAVHGPFGMQAEGRLLVPPHPKAATVRVDGDGRIGFGDWPALDDGRAVAPSDLLGLVEFRQNLDPLVAVGQANPKGRSVWGDHLYGSLVPAERSALCTTAAGVLFYAWSPEISAEALADALLHVGCSYALHLDMNPGHCTFALNAVQSFQPLHASGVVLDTRMRVNANRYLRWSPQDFFYLAERTALPARSTLTWSSRREPGAPLLFAVGRGATGGLAIEVDRVPLDAVHLDVHPGSAEDDSISPPATASEGPALLGWGLGHRTPGTRSGLLLGTTSVVPLTRADASLVLDGESAPVLLPPGMPVVPKEGQQVVQLPVLARAGELSPLARELGDRRPRAALCVANGHILVGRIEHDTIAPLVATLLTEGCSLIVALDRGSHHRARVEREGDSPSPRVESSLWASPRRLTHRGYIFE